jgi:hypothetical protein
LDFDSRQLPRQTRIAGPEVGRFLAAQVGARNVSAARRGTGVGFLFVEQALLKHQDDPVGVDPAGSRGLAMPSLVTVNTVSKKYWISGSSEALAGIMWLGEARAMFVE